MNLNPLVVSTLETLDTQAMPAVMRAIADRLDALPLSSAGALSPILVSVLKSVDYILLPDLLRYCLDRLEGKRGIAPSDLAESAVDTATDALEDARFGKVSE